MSISLLRFKQRSQPDLDAWIERAARLLKPLNFAPDTIILRALRHDEISVRPEFTTSLDLLSQSLADHLHCRYQPAHLLKSRITLPGKHLTRRQRDNQLKDLFLIPDPITSLPPPPFLLIDDILTTGATMRALFYTLNNHYPASPISAFTLTRAVYPSSLTP
jgi:ATP-dependent DNA helicase RecQ